MNRPRSLFSFLWLLSFAFLFTASGQANNYSSGNKGTTSASFLKLGAGARARSMGDAFTAVSDDATSIYWNVGAMTAVKQTEISLTHADYLESSIYDHASFVKPFSGKQAIGIDVQYFSAGNLTERDANGLEQGDFRPHDASASLGYAHNIGSYGFGGSIKYVESKIFHTAQTVTMDLGFLTPRYFDRLRFGLSASNLFGSLKYDVTEEKLPQMIATGLSYQAATNWLLSSDVKFPKDDKAYAAFGTELVLGRGSVNLKPRLGYNTRTLDVGGLAGLSAGLGFAFRSLSLDYAFVPFEELGDSHLVSLSYRF